MSFLANVNKIELCTQNKIPIIDIFTVLPSGESHRLLALSLFLSPFSVKFVGVWHSLLSGLRQVNEDLSSLSMSIGSLKKGRKFGLETTSIDDFGDVLVPFSSKLSRFSFSDKFFSEKIDSDFFVQSFKSNPLSKRLRWKGCR